MAHYDPERTKSANGVESPNVRDMELFRRYGRGSIISYASLPVAHST
jgi:hypothetical protein